jgi:hypothetical protein
VDTVTSSSQKLRALVLTLLTLGSLFAGVAAFSGVGAAANTAQLDFSDIYDADVVRGTADSTDGDFDNGGYTLVSSSKAQAVVGSPDDGVPDDGVFPAVTDVHPKFDLADFNSDDNNAWQTTGIGSQTASVSDGQYETVHVVASAGGASPSTPAKFELKLHYADGTSDTSSVLTVPDWFGSPPSDPGYAVRDGMDRYDADGNSYENANEAGIWGYGVSADSSKTLTDVTIDVTENQAGSFNFFGGAATTKTSDVVNSPPSASDDSDSTDEDTSVTVDVVANDADPDGDTLDVTAITNGPNHGNAKITGASNDQIQFDPGTDETGDVRITYEVSDGNGGTDTAKLSITVNPVNDAPTASDDTGTTDEDTPLSIADGDSTDLLNLASDVDGDTLSLAQIDGATFSSGTPVALSSGAEVTANADGSWTYDPNGQFESLGNGETDTDSFTYTVTDGNGGTAQGTITVTITGITDSGGPVEQRDETPPTADAGSDRSVDVGESVTFDGTNSTDDDAVGTIQWDIDDDGRYERASATTTHTFDSPGEHTVTVRVWDESSNYDTDTVLVTVSPAGSAENGTEENVTETPKTPTPTATPGTGPSTPNTDRPGQVGDSSGNQTETPGTGPDPIATTPDSTASATTAMRTTDGFATSGGTSTAGATSTTGTGPGFGLGASLAALIVAGYLANRRRKGT